MSRPAAEAVFVTLLVTAFAGALAWPVPIAPSDFWVGAGLHDHASVAWSFDFVARQLASGHLPWGHTDRIEFPGGSNLFPADPLEAVLFSPLTLAIGAIATYNFVALLHHGLAAGLTFGWLRREGAEPAGAATGALAVAFHGALVATTFNGNADVTAFYWVPAALWASAVPGWGAVAGLCAAAGGWCTPYVGVMATIALLVRTARDRRWRDAAAGIAVAAVGAGALIWLTNGILNGMDSAIRKGPRADLSGVASLADLVRPWPVVTALPPPWDESRLANGGYLGLVVVAAALLARDRRAAIALVAAGVVLSLGRELAITGAVHEGGPGTGIPMPWALVSVLPGLGRLEITSRFTGLAVVGLAWLASDGVRRLGRAAWLVPVGVIVDQVAIGRAYALIGAAPLDQDESCALLADLAPGPVLDLPPSPTEIWMQAELCHRRPVAEGINRPLHPDAAAALDLPNAAEAGGLLRARGWRWLVVHGREGTPLPDALRALDGCVAAREGRVVVYDLDCPALIVPETLPPSQRERRAEHRKRNPPRTPR